MDDINNLFLNLVFVDNIFQISCKGLGLGLRSQSIAEQAVALSLDLPVHTTPKGKVRSPLKV